MGGRVSRGEKHFSCYLVMVPASVTFAVQHLNMTVAAIGGTGAKRVAEDRVDKLLEIVGHCLGQAWVQSQAEIGPGL